MHLLRTLSTVILAATMAVASTLNVNAAPVGGLGASATPVSSLKVAKDFKVDLLYTVPKGQEGSWVAMAGSCPSVISVFSMRAYAASTSAFF